jgi:nicotinate-nucleotide pyrophosphorylase (carboxylating)
MGPLSDRPVFGDDERANALALIELAVREDLDERGDITTSSILPANATGSAEFVMRSPGVIAGLPVVRLLAERFGLASGYSEMAHDGVRADSGQTLARLTGSMHSILAMERTSLNFLQHLSGIATLTDRFVSEVKGTRASILDTRKTTPGWRMLEKYAVRCGGGENHRIGLWDAVLIKDNHLAALESSDDPIGTAIAFARAHSPAAKFFEVEVDRLEQLDRALACGADIVLLDNLAAESLAEAVRRRDDSGATAKLEASGGITLATVAGVARAGVDRISVGALTHSAPALDIGLDYVASSAS